jgi:4-phosphopantoate---beta-alanine ligase
LFFLGERTTASAETATTAATALLLLARLPALSVNGETWLPWWRKRWWTWPAHLPSLWRSTSFIGQRKRIRKIADLLRAKGAKEVLGEHPDASVPGLDLARALATRGGIYDADVVLIPLEDGDRCEALVAMGKKVIAIDLNPLSRTARKATVSIVDNILRALPNMAAQVKQLSDVPRADLEKVVREYENERCSAMRRRRYGITWKGSLKKISSNPSSPAPPSASSDPASDQSRQVSANVLGFWRLLLVPSGISGKCGVRLLARIMVAPEGRLLGLKP